MTAGVALGLTAATLSLGISGPASANPAGTGLVISEVYGGGGNTGATFTNDFVELYNPTASPISVAGWSVQYRTAAGTTAQLTNLTGTVPAGGHYLVQEAAGTVVFDKPLPTPDATGNIAMSGTNGVVILASNTVGVTAVGDFAGTNAPANVVDTVGYGTTPTTFEATNTATALTNTTSAARAANGADTDANNPDFTEGAPTPTNAADSAPADLTAVSPGTKTSVVNRAITPFTLEASGGTAPYAWTATGLPAGLSISTDGTVSGTPTATGTSEVSARVTDDADPEGSAVTTFTYSVTEPGAVTPIAAIQGDGAASPLAGTDVTTEGVVTAAYPTGGFDGFYLQTGGTGGATDATPGASDAVFVYTPSLPAAGYPAIGDSVEVNGPVSERFNQTQITVAAANVVPETLALAPVTPLAEAYPTTETAREAHEGELLAPTDEFTVSNTFGSNTFGEIGLATGGTPLLQPTDVVDFQTGNPGAVTADNLARGVVLDDGASINYSPNGNTVGGNKNIPLPWQSTEAPIRVGATATLTGPVVLKFDFGFWRFQPTDQVTDRGTDVATFENTRTDAPEAVGGDARLATFNVLNYFPTTGQEYVASGRGTCTYFNDRAGVPITNQTCSNNGPRGAATTASFERQEAKIVSAISALDASVVSLEEIENSVQFGKDRDFAVSTLVDALNEDAGSDVWDFVPSPAAADLPTPAQEDVIRTAFIYKPAEVSPVGASEVLIDETNFDNAREPLAQAFKAVDAPDTEAFGVIVNHFKSKGGAPSAGENADTGQGGFNADRIGQANALSAFADTFAADRGIEAMFLAGDFNSYTQEDPLQELYADGYTNLESDTEGEVTYSFSGLSGSLDHVLANEAALALVEGVDIWNINSPESLAFEYSRFNNNVTDFYQPGPFKASDHDPEVIGLMLAEAPAVPVDINLLNFNDFHGRIDANTTRFATTIERLRAEEGEGNTLLLSAGDSLGASLFASSVQQDQPTIDVLNALDLATSAVGNHEFDQGFADLTDRIEPASDWDYLGANVYDKGTETPALPEYETFDVDGVTVGVIGVVTQETPSLVSPAGVADLDFGNPVEAVNRVTTQLSDGDATNGEADVIVAEYHEGSPANAPDGTPPVAGESTVFDAIVNDTSAEVDAIFTGHTHRRYAYAAPVPGQAGVTRPIIQTGSYGDAIGQAVLTFDPTTGEVTTHTERTVSRSTTEDLGFPRVQQVKQITDAALANAATVGNQPVASITADITTAFTGGSYVNGKYVGGTRDDRASESTLGDLVANALRDGVSEFATPDLGITNPGGLRAELLFAGNTAGNPANTDGVVTFAEANGVLPFNNTVAVVELTGTQLKQVLEQQYQTDANGNVPTRAYLQLGLSDNVRVTTDPTAAAGSRITSVTINDEVLDPAATYTVSTLSFLATGGDNFRAFTQGDSVDTGLLDAQMWRDYLADNSPVSPDFARQQVTESGLPDVVTAGEPTTFTLSKLDLTSQGSPANTEIVATVGDEVVGTFPVANGTSTIALTVPASTPAGVVTLTANPSGTVVTVPLEAAAVPEPVPSTVTGTDETFSYGQMGTVEVSVTGAGDVDATGTVELFNGDTLLGSTELVDGAGEIDIDALTLEPGTYELTLVYSGDSVYEPSEGSVTVTVDKADSVISASASPATVEVLADRSTVRVFATASGYVPTGTVDVFRGTTLLGSGELDGGVATVRLPVFDTLGDVALSVRYRGDDLSEGDDVTTGVSVVKQEPTVKVIRPAEVKKGGTPLVRVTVRATGTEATGQVRASFNGKSVTGRLVDGKVSLRLPEMNAVGNTQVTVRYLGDDLLTAASETVTIKVVKP